MQIQFVLSPFRRIPRLYVEIHYSCCILMFFATNGSVYMFLHELHEVTHSDEVKSARSHISHSEIIKGLLEICTECSFVSCHSNMAAFYIKVKLGLSVLSTRG